MIHAFGRARVPPGPYNSRSTRSDPMRSTLSFAVLSLAAATALAQAPQPPYLNVVSLGASAAAEVPTDTLTVTLFAEEQGPDPAQVATRVNARLKEALARAKAQPNVDARSGSYQTTPVYDRAGPITGWRVRADLVLESRDFGSVGALAGALQPALKLASMVFSLSRSAQEAAEAALLTEALRKFQDKARAIAKGLGFPGYTLGQIAVRNDALLRGPLPYRATAMATMADAAPAAPVPVEGGKNTVTVVVAGSVIVGPGR
jgi:predicted secreted protein